ncbi:transporter substrate-binding domain-containing protein [Paraglaciecola sp.]|uniref:substrate-binding periplasmic protein n=1 Tax=Paraglaciecola sp. TaxID=1920173 RepID=UPI0030F3AC67
MKVRNILFYVMLNCLLSVNVFAKEVLRSAVSPEFPNGLHAKYLQFIANKMDMELDIAFMPFARRLKELHNGQIDMLVGMLQESDDVDDIIYLHPSYEKLRQTFYILTQDKNRFVTATDMHKAMVGMTNSAEYYSDLDKNEKYHVITVSTLKQKIELLLKGRIDCFMHHEESTLLLLKKLGLEDKVAVSHYQPNNYEKYYISISKKSALYANKNALEKMLKSAVDNNDFVKIRNEHYHL